MAGEDGHRNELDDPQTYQIIGAAMEVHRILGRGFLEAVYRESLAIEFDLRKIPFQREVETPIYYKDRELRTKYRADFICYDKDVIVETKALDKISGKEESQILNYLKATRIKRGLILNFGTKSLEFKRYILTDD